MAEQFEDYITAINAAETAEDAFGVIAKIAREFGYDYVVYSLATDHPSLGLKRQHGLGDAYPEDWMKHYLANNYIDIDPVFSEVVNSSVPFFWTSVIEKKPLASNSLRLMNEAEECGLREGLAVPLHGKGGEVAAVGLARTEWTGERNYLDLAVFQFLSTYFHETYKNMIRPTAISLLTDREREVLLWAADGKTDLDISDILCISQPTVRYRWNRIFEKLDVRGRVNAVTKAIRLGIITPQAIR